MLRNIWRIFGKVTLAIGLALTFFAVIEVLRAYDLLYRIHPLAGKLYLALLGGAILYLVVRYMTTMATRPRVLMPPQVGDPAEADARMLRRYARFLSRLCRRLGENETLSAERRAAAREARERLKATLGARDRDPAALRERVLEAETRCVRPAVDELERVAEREVRKSVRDVMFGVALSAWRSADLGVTVYRNITMVLLIVRIFDNRPPLREQLSILKDIISVVATVNFLNFGSRLLQNLFASVPVLGRFADDIAQGVGAGMMTSVAGHAAVYRCRSFRGWDQVEAKRTISRNLGGYLVDISQIVSTDLMPRMRKPIEARLPEEEPEPELFEKTTGRVEKVLDETAEVMDRFVDKPAAEAGHGVTSGGAAFGQTVARAPSRAWRGLRWTGLFFASPLRRKRESNRAEARDKDRGEPGA